MLQVFVFKSAIVLSPLVFFLPARWKSRWGLLLQLTLAIVTFAWAVEAWQSETALRLDLGIPFWGGTPSLIIDRLSAFFILLINIVCLSGVWYSCGYLRPQQASKSSVSLSIHAWAMFALHASMLHVVAMREGFAFLMAWEVMSMSSFLLVIFDGEEEGTLGTGIKYLVQMHAGFTLLLLGFLWVSHITGDFGFDGLATYFASHNNWIIFLVFFAGFGIKAGFIPLHTWLPHAHPAAPSSVSGVMSGVMIKMGIYGIMRVVIHLQSDFLVIGLVLVAFSLMTSLGGILFASVQNDIKRLLAYSSIENIGIIGIGLGVAVLGHSFNKPVLTSLALAGSLMHIFNHGLYKSMLFFTAGNVYYASHTRDINKLGGMIKAMPVSGALFLIGALSISVIPPFSGFVSEFLIYSGVFQGIGSATFTESMILLAVILTLVIVGGLSVYSFTKAFGLVFLGSSRSQITPAEVPLGMRLSGSVAVLGIFLVAFLSPWMIGRIAEVGQQFGQIGFRTSAISAMVPSLRNISTINGLLLLAAILIFVLRRVVKRKAVDTGPTWGCGYSAADAHHQYTASSYGRYIQELAGPSITIREFYTPIPPDEIFPGTRNFNTETKDIVEEKIITKPIGKVVERMARLGWVQTGKISHYLAYPMFFLLIIALLTRLGIL